MTFLDMRSTVFFLFILCFISCQQPSGSGNIDLSSYTTTELSGGVTKAQKITADGTVIEEGYVSNGMMNGVWLTFHPNQRIKSSTTYSNNLKSGPHFEFNNRGQMELNAFFDHGDLNGPYEKYKSGRFLSQATYKAGQLDGDYKEFFESGRNAGKIQKLVQFKEGMQHGKLENYNEEGIVTVSYLYKDGKKMEGGIVDK